MIKGFVGLFISVVVMSLGTGLALAQNAQTLVVYSATDTDAVMPVVKVFMTQNPDIRVDYHEYNTLELYSEVLLPTHGATTPDVVISSAMDLQVNLINKGLAHAFVSSEADTLPGWASWRHELYGFTYEPAAIVYNRAAFAERDLPTTHAELAGMIRDDPVFFDGRIGTYDIRKSGVGYLFATQDAIQDQQIYRLTESLGRAKSRVYSSTADMVAKVASGDLVLSYNVIGSYALAAATADPNIAVYLLEDYTLVMARTAFIPKLSRKIEPAKRFINFLLSVQGQKTMAQHSALIPINPSVLPEPAKALLTHGQNSFLPIKLGPGLLAYLDDMKRRGFLNSWEAIVRPADMGLD